MVAGTDVYIGYGSGSSGTKVPQFEPSGSHALLFSYSIKKHLTFNLRAIDFNCKGILSVPMLQVIELVSSKYTTGSRIIKTVFHFSIFSSDWPIYIFTWHAIDAFNEKISAFIENFWKACLTNWSRYGLHSLPMGCPYSYRQKLLLRCYRPP